MAFLRGIADADVTDVNKEARFLAVAFDDSRLADVHQISQF